MKTVLLILVSTVLLLAAGGVALHLWLDLEGVSLGAHGWGTATANVPPPARGTLSLGSPS